ncbi:MAG: hypothetical protein ACAI44_17190, partial [Candidatus Sericytochromatia bacterium]
DGLDQVYFSVGKDNYVLQGDDLKLGEVREVMKKGVPTTVVMLDGKPAEIKIEKLDDEVTSVGDGFYHNGAKIGISTQVAIVGAPVVGLSGLGWLVASMAGSKSGQAWTTGGMYVGAAMIAGGVVGAAFFSGKSVVQGLANKPKIDNSKDILSQELGSQNEAKSAGRMSVLEKNKAAKEVITGVITDIALDALLK